LPSSVNGVSICWRLGSSDRCELGPLGVLAPGERRPITASITSQNTDSSEFEILIIFVSSVASP
jgi:hypothetical protein